MKLEVPYYSQFLDVVDPFWMVRACGAISLKMIAEYHGKHIPEIVAFCKEAYDCGGYDMKNGWVHDYLVMKARELGFNAERKEGLTAVDTLVASLKHGNPVIVSVEKRTLEQVKYHMLVLVGYEERDGVITDFYYHEPESTSRERGQYRTCTAETFLTYWRGKAIFISQ